MKRQIMFLGLGLPRRLKWRGFAWGWRHLMPPVAPAPPPYALLVTTYIARFDTFFKSLLMQLGCLFADRTIVVAANGHYDGGQQAEYLARLRGFLRDSPNVRLIAMEQPVGLATLWNRGIRVADCERVLVLNDDLYLMPDFRRQIDVAFRSFNGVMAINGSWSHFIIARGVLDRVGWFDEGYEEIGYEDMDFCARLACAGIGVDVLETTSVWNCVAQPEVYSYGVAPELVEGKYSGRNQRRFTGKWELSEGNAPGAVWVPALGQWVRPRPPA